MKKTKLGEILLDTGVLLIGDIKNLKKFKQDTYKNNAKLKDTTTGKIYEYKVDFHKYSDILFDSKTVSELLEESKLEKINDTNDTELSTENIISDLEKGFKQLNFESGTTGKAFAFLNLNGEGFYPIYLEETEDGTERLVIEFQKQDSDNEEVIKKEKGLLT